MNGLDTDDELEVQTTQALVRHVENVRREVAMHIACLHSAEVHSP